VQVAATSPALADPQVPAPRQSASRRRSAAVAIVVAVVAVAATAMAVQRHDTPRTLAGAISTASSDRRFASTPRAANSLVEISQILTLEARQCVAHHGASYPPCSARASGAAVAQNEAVAVLRCTQPGVYEARQGIRRYLEGIRRLDIDSRAPTPPFPTFPHC